VIVTFFNQETLAAKRATVSVPIVMCFGIAPVERGLVASLARPGGNVTGTTVAPIAPGKYLELLKDVVPKLATIAVLSDPSGRAALPTVDQSLEAQAQKLGLTLMRIDVQRSDEIESALAGIAKERPGALLVFPSGGGIMTRTRQIIDFATRHRVPTIYPARDYVEAGALMSYGYDREQLVKRAAWYVDRVLRGTKPADLPVEQPTKFELVINLKTAKALGLTIPPAVLARADEIIQ
jgi:ABC-type uncharacterized transport system substrate-binding protein